MRTLGENKGAGLAHLLFGHNRGAVLALLFSDPDKSLYVRQIARTVGASAGAVAPELAQLTRHGLLVSSRIGNHVFYKANQQNPIFPELKVLLEKTLGVFELLRSALAPLADRIEFAFVYGSLAKREETAQSDVDLMVVGQVELEEVLERIQAVEKRIARPINPTVYSSEEFKTKLASRNHFVTSVVRGPKVFIIGDEDELGRVSRQ